MSITIDKAEYDELKQQNTRLRHGLDQLKRLIFGAKSERFTPSATPEQLAWWEQAGADAGAEKGLTARRTRPASCRLSRSARSCTAIPLKAIGNSPTSTVGTVMVASTIGEKAVQPTVKL